MEDTSIHMDIHQVCNCINAAKQHLLHQGQEALPNAPPSCLLLSSLRDLLALFVDCMPFLDQSSTGHVSMTSMCQTIPDLGKFLVIHCILMGVL